MKCKLCGLEMEAVKSGMQPIEGTNNMVAIHLLGCRNRACSLYVGDDRNNPKNIQHRQHSELIEGVNF